MGRRLKNGRGSVHRNGWLAIRRAILLCQAQWAVVELASIADRRSCSVTTPPKKGATVRCVPGAARAAMSWRSATAASRQGAAVSNGPANQLCRLICSPHLKRQNRRSTSSPFWTITVRLSRLWPERHHSCALCECCGAAEFRAPVEILTDKAAVVTGVAKAPLLELEKPHSARCGGAAPRRLGQIERFWGCTACGLDWRSKRPVFSNLRSMPESDRTAWSPARSLFWRGQHGQAGAASAGAPTR